MFRVHNPSSVTQRILGMRHPGPTPRSPLTFWSAPPAGAPGDLTYSAASATVPPHHHPEVRYVLRSLMWWAAGRSDPFTEVALRVGVGAFIRTADVGLGDHFGYVLRATRRTCLTALPARHSRG